MKLSATAALLLLLLLVPPYVPFLFAHQALFQGDIFLYFEPTLRYMAANVLSGRLPLWNPLVCGGVPQIAIISPGLFYLPNLLFLALPFGLALALSLMLHQWLAGVGTYLLLKARSLNPVVAITGGAMVMLCGYMFGSSQCYTLPATFAWTPLALYFLDRLLTTGAIPWLAALALSFAMQILAGRPELFGGASLIYAVYVAVHFWWNRKPLLIVKPVIALALGTGLAAVALLPVMELYLLSPRMSGLRFGEVALWSAGWFDWLQLIVSQPFGDLVVGNYQLSPHYPGLFPYISSLFLGPAVFSLGFVGFCQRTWKLRWFWLCLALFFGLLAMGSFGPLLPVIFHLLPGAAVLRYPIKLAVFALFALAIAAAEGFEVVTKGGITAKAAACMSAGWATGLTIGIVLWLNLNNVAGSAASTILGPRFALIGSEMSNALQSAGAKLSFAGLLGVLTAVLCLLIARRPAQAKWWTGLLLLTAVLPMSWSGEHYLWHTTDQFFYEQPSPLADWLHEKQKETKDSFRTLDFLPDSLLSPRRLWRPGDPLLHAVLQSGYERQILQADVNMDFGVASPYGFMPTDSKAFMMVYVGVCSRSRQYADPQRVGPISDLPLYRFCQISNTRYLATLTNRPDPVRRIVGPMPILDSRYFKIATEMPDLNLRVYELAEPLPRAYFRSYWEGVPSQVQALKEIFWADHSSFDPARSVLINAEGEALPTASGSPAGHEQGVVRLLSDTGERVELQVSNEEPGFCILSDTQYPGWKAYDGSAPLRIYQANGLYRAVWLEPGRHRVSFVFKPYSLFWGQVISLASLFAIMLIFAGALYDSRRRS